MITLENIQTEFPESADTVRRLEAILNNESTDEFTLEYLYGRVSPDSTSILAQILSAMIDEEYLELVIRVVSPESRAGLRDYHSFNELPAVILDEVDTGEQMRVTRENLEILYRVR